ncbi:MAG TPA: hypothetical protein PKD09_05980 [Aggregatilinea sp.]|uniref:hypothetical protein n=1 Tax=Aggregatilinea sp. TaxID=2806333 RepID=UPI002BD0BB8B|nr:hypothetical protein [Aggregatilinea sp.]HML21174.1 hypothetical protein [Aggregatilinea sp.]
MKTEREKLKQQIIVLIQRNGHPLRYDDLAERLALPDTIALDDLIAELVIERRLSKSYTFQANGAPDCTYDSRDNTRRNESSDGAFARASHGPASPIDGG